MSEPPGALPGSPLPLDWDRSLSISRMHGGPPPRDDKEAETSTRRTASIRKAKPKIDCQEQRLVTPQLLAELQDEVGVLEKERGTASESLMQKSLILSEETFEVLKLLRRKAGVATARVPKWSLSDELVDILFVSAAIANRVPARLEILWLNACADQATSAAVPGDIDSEIVLATVLELSQRVLSVVGICRDLTNHRSPELEESLSLALAQLLCQVTRVARVSEVDLRLAVDHKLMKDQLRLWST